MTTATLDRRHDGYYLLGRKLALRDVLELRLPMIPGWCRGRFAVINDDTPILIMPTSTVRLDLDLVDEIRWPDDVPRFTCPACKRTSFNPNDVRDLYCGACHESFA